MADWVYAIGETDYDQGFVMFDTKTKQPYDATGITAINMTIVTSDLQPSQGPNSLGVDTLNPLRALYSVTTANMPQVKGSYYVIIQLKTFNEIRKTFEFDLQVRRG
jgi:hypothetical protein